MGSIYRMEDKPEKRCRKWRLSVSLGKSATGGYVRKTRSFTGTKREAERALADFEAACAPLHGQTTSTLRECVAPYIEWKATKVKPRTVDTHHWALNSLCYKLGDTRICDITPQMVEDALAEMMAGDTRSGEPIGGTYANKLHQVLRCLLDWAVWRGLLNENALKGAKAPKLTLSRRKVLSPREVACLLDALDFTVPGGALVGVIATLGLRRAEAADLMWENVDFEGGCVEVTDSKTEAGKRIIPMSDAAREVLTQRRRAVEKRLVQLGLEDAGTVRARRRMTQRLACAKVGEDPYRPMSPEGLSHWWMRNRENMPVPPDLTLHELRHTWATNLVKSGCDPATLQALMGHTDPTTALKIYTHVNVTMQRDALARLDALVCK